MNELPEQKPINRILVALDASLGDLVALDTAAGLAARIRAELVALFIEDVNLIHLAALPFAREVDRVSAVARQLDSPRMDRALRMRAEQVRQALDRAAAQRQLRASLRVVRGHYVAEALSAATGMDVLFLNRVGGATLTRTPTISPQPARRMPREKPAMQKPIWVLYDGSPGALRALRLARDLSQTSGGGLVIVFPAASGDAKWFSEQTARLLGEQRWQVRYVGIPVADASCLLRSVRPDHCGLLVLHRGSPLLEGKAAQDLLDRLDCPVVLSA